MPTATSASPARTAASAGPAPGSRTIFAWLTSRVEEQVVGAARTDRDALAGAVDLRVASQRRNQGGSNRQLLIWLLRHEREFTHGGLGTAEARACGVWR